MYTYKYFTFHRGLDCICCELKIRFHTVVWLCSGRVISVVSWTKVTIFYHVNLCCLLLSFQSSNKNWSFMSLYLFFDIVRLEKLSTPGEEVLGSIPTVTAGSPLVGSVSVLCDLLRQKSWSPHSVSCVAASKIVRCQSWDPSAIKPT